jgi:hypothetical protein
VVRVRGDKRLTDFPTSTGMEQGCTTIMSKNLLREVAKKRHIRIVNKKLSEEGMIDRKNNEISGEKWKSFMIMVQLK